MPLQRSAQHVGGFKAREPAVYVFSHFAIIKTVELDVVRSTADPQVAQRRHQRVVVSQRHARPVGRDHQQMSGRTPLRETAQHPNGRRIAPVKILQDQQQRFPRRNRLEASEQLVLEPFRHHTLVPPPHQIELGGTGELR